MSLPVFREPKGASFAVAKIFNQKQNTPTIEKHEAEQRRI